MRRAAAIVIMCLCASSAFGQDADAGPMNYQVGFVELTDFAVAGIKKGTKWLYRSMNPDGGCGIDIGAPSDIGCTAMVGLALLSQGSTPDVGPHRHRLRKIRKFILRAVRNMPGHDITSRTGTQIQNDLGPHAHSFLAALFLSQLAGMEQGKTPTRAALKKIVRVIARAQQPDGTWGTGFYLPMLGTVTGWMSLRGSSDSGVTFKASAKRTARWVIEQIRQDNSSGSRSLFRSASGIRVLYAMSRHKDPSARRAFERALKIVKNSYSIFNQAGGEHYLAFHLITEVTMQKGGDEWRRWFPVVRDKLLRVQNRDGSWTGHQCITSRTFSTAAVLLTLQAPYRYLPISDI